MTTYGPSSIDPSEWTCMGVFYQGHSQAMHDAYGQDLADLCDNLDFAFWVFTGSSDGEINPKINQHRNGGCASCGSHFAHGAIFRRGTDEYVSVGHVCGSELFGLSDLETKKRRKNEKKAKVIANHNEGETFAHEHGLVPIFALVDDLYGDQASAVQSMLAQLHKKGYLSEKQVNYLKLIQKWHEERVAKQAEKKAEQTAVPVTTDRIEISGTVISTKWVEDDFGGRLKMLVEDDRNFRVWGSVPMSLDNVDSGDRVKFTARVEQSKKDESFGFYSRPTQAKKEEVTV
jgi:hypothetical protein